MPVAEHAVERLEVLRRGNRRLLRIGPFVDVPIGRETVLDGGAPHELPDTASLCPRQRRGLERAFNQGHVGQIQWQALGPEDVLDHRQVLGASRQAVPKELAQAALEDLHPAQDPVVRGNRDVVGRGLEILGHGLYRGQLRRSGVEGLDGEQLVDGRRLGPSLGEAVPGRQRLLFEDGNLVHQPIEMLAHPDVGVGTLGCLEQHVQGSVELVPGAFEVAKRQLLLAGLEMSIRTREEAERRILRRSRRGGHDDGRCRRR